MAVARVLFVCFQNAGKSVIAEALFNRHADKAKAVASSAGIAPAGKVYPALVKVAECHGLDLSSFKSNLLTPELAAQHHLVVSCGCLDKIPHVPSTTEITDWQLPDAKAKTEEEFEIMTQAAENAVHKLIKEKGWGF